MARCDEPAQCPRCGRAAPRALSLPSMSFLDGATRRAHARNEKSAHSPEVVRRPAAAPDPGPRSRPRPARGHRDRPWMVGH